MYMGVRILHLRVKFSSLYHLYVIFFFQLLSTRILKLNGVTFTHTPPTGPINTNPSNFTNYNNSHKIKSQFSILSEHTVQR